MKHNKAELFILMHICSCDSITVMNKITAIETEMSSRRLHYHHRKLWNHRQPPQDFSQPSTYPATPISQHDEISVWGAWTNRMRCDMSAYHVLKLLNLITTLENSNVYFQPQYGQHHTIWVWVTECNQKQRYLCSDNFFNKYQLNGFLLEEVAT